MKWNLIDRIRRRPYLDTSRGKDGVRYEAVFVCKTITMIMVKSGIITYKLVLIIQTVPANTSAVK
jgi:hypothetical protein